MKHFSIVATFLITLLMCACSVEEPMTDSRDQSVQTDPNFVSLNEALEAAESYFSGIYGSKTRSARKVSNVELLNVRKTRGVDQEYGYYVVNYDNGSGFSLLSADRRRNAVYAISDEGSLNLADTIYNEGLNWYINDFLPVQGGVDRAVIKPDTTLHPISGDRYLYYTTCAPLLNGFMRRFDQIAPFNKYCFTQDGKQALVGCVPLAVGTFIGYNKWPNKIEGYSFDWEAMYANSTHDSWYRLFEVVGRSGYLYAKYGTSATSASMYVAQNMLEKIGYKNVKFNKFDIDSAFNELKNNRLFMVSGSRLNNGQRVGHAWIIDGSSRRAIQLAIPSIEAGHPVYKYEDFYHCIWGWGGQSNGFYLYSNKLGGVAHEYDAGTNYPGNIYEDLEMFTGEKP